jgi:ferrous iron transport protein B
MHCHGDGSTTDHAATGESVILVGHPNVGKSALFGQLTGRYVTVSNYPGTTVEIVRGRIAANGRTDPIIDTPGVNSLFPISEDERVTQRILLGESPRVVVQVGDSKNLPRTLMLALQLAEMEVPFILDLNMADEARQRGITIDTERLAQILGADVFCTSAVKGEGTDQLVAGLGNPRRPSLRVPYGEDIERAIEAIAALMPESHIGTRYLATTFLADDAEVADWIAAEEGGTAAAKASEIRETLQARYGQPLSYVLNEQRLQFAHEIAAQVTRQATSGGDSWGDIIGRWTIHPLGGIPFVLVVLFVTYKVVGEFGAQTLVDLLETHLFGQVINPWSAALVRSWIPVPLLQDFLVGPYGMIPMALTYSFAIVLPIVSTFFLIFSFLEDSGYLPRLAVMVNRIFKAMGLNGKAVLPMILGLGCDTMATMTTRILDSRKERLQVTLLLALGVPCSAQLGVILGMIAFLGMQAALIWGGVVVGTMLTVGFLSARVLPGRGSDFILELPPIRWPRLSNILVKTLARLEWYLREVVPLFVLGTAILFVLDKLTLLAAIERLSSPLVVTFLGLPAAATDAFLIGFLRRDYGAAGLFALARAGSMTPDQILVSLVTITLFVPCIANVLMIAKEYGNRVALAMSAFIFPFAFLVGGLLHFALRVFA